MRLREDLWSDPPPRRAWLARLTHRRRSRDCVGWLRRLRKLTWERQMKSIVVQSLEQAG